MFLIAVIHSACRFVVILMTHKKWSFLVSIVQKWSYLVTLPTISHSRSLFLSYNFNLILYLALVLASALSLCLHPNECDHKRMDCTFYAIQTNRVSFIYLFIYSTANKTTMMKIKKSYTYSIGKGIK